MPEDALLDVSRRERQIMEIIWFPLAGKRRRYKSSRICRMRRQKPLCAR